MSYYEAVLILVMRDEIATTMRLLGVTRLDQLGPHLVSQPCLPSNLGLLVCFIPLPLVLPIRGEREASKGPKDITSGSNGIFANEQLNTKALDPFLNDKLEYGPHEKR